MSKSRLSAPEGCRWRPSTINARVLILERADYHMIGSIERKGILWQNLETGETFIDKNDAAKSVARFASYIAASAS